MQEFRMAIVRTPLRYPGGKSSLSAFLRSVFEENGLQDITYVEPFAGGAGAAINLLIEGHVNRIVLNDVNPAIYKFWRSVVEHTDEFLQKLYETPISIDEWNTQKKIFSNISEYSDIEVGFATFYLNRCNHSGILTANPIGGINQTGKWKIDARYKKESLENRIKNIAAHKDKISIHCLDALTFIKDLSANRQDNIFFYLDPPYYKKGSQLYLNAFMDKSHEELRNVLQDIENVQWVLTYDNTPEILALYENWCSVKEFSLNYFAFRAKVGAELLIYNKQLKLPPSGIKVKYGIATPLPHFLPDTSEQLA